MKNMGTGLSPEEHLRPQGRSAVGAGSGLEARIDKKALFVEVAAAKDFLRPEQAAALYELCSRSENQSLIACMTRFLAKGDRLGINHPFSVVVGRFITPPSRVFGQVQTSLSLQGLANLMGATSDLVDSEAFREAWRVADSMQDTAFFESQDKTNTLVQRVAQVTSSLTATGITPRLTAQNLDVVELIVTKSHEPRNDLATALISPNMTPVLDAPRLAEFYSKGHHYIYLPSAIKTSPTIETPSLLLPHSPAREQNAEVLRRFSLSEHYPPLHLQRDLVTRMTSHSERTQSTLLTLLTSPAGAGPESGNVLQLLKRYEACRVERGEGFAVAFEESLEAIVSSTPERASHGIALLDDLMRLLPDQVETYVDSFRRNSLEAIERELARIRMEQHHGQFKEKAIDAVLDGFRVPTNRSGEAVSQKVLQRTKERYQHLLAVAEDLIVLRDEAIIARISDVTRGQEHLRSEAGMIEFFSLVREQIKREFGIYPYNTQLMTSLLLNDEEFIKKDDGSFARGVYTQVSTGEGKSVILAMNAAYRAALGEKVDVITTNLYLARRGETLLHTPTFTPRVGCPA